MPDFRAVSSRDSEEIQPDVVAVGGGPQSDEADETEVRVDKEPGCDDVVGANGEVVRIARSGSGVTAAPSKRRQSFADQSLAKDRRLQIAVVQDADSTEQAELAVAMRSILLSRVQRSKAEPAEGKELFTRQGAVRIGKIRRRKAGDDSLGDRVLAVLGNPVSGKGHAIAGVGVSGQGIVDRNIKARKISVADRLRRHRGDPAGIAVITGPFVAGKKEQLLALDRPPQSRPPLVEDELSLVPVRRVEQVAGAQVLVVMVLEKGPVKLVGAALELNIDGGAAGEPLLGVEGAGHDVDGLNCLERRDVGGDVRRLGIGRRRAVDARVIDLIAGAVDVE